MASRLRLANLIALVDNNGLQSDGFCKDIMGVDYRMVWESFGWNVLECDGHSVEQLKKAISSERRAPTVIIANTIKGKGVSFMEQNNEWHHHTLSEDQFRNATQEVCDHYEI